jgi:flagellar hook-associated protein 2
MSTLTFPGLSTGIDTSAIIAQLIAVEGRTRDVYQARLTALEVKKDTLGSLETKLSAMLTSSRALSDADTLRAFSVSSSDEDKVTADATNNASEGNHTVVVNQLATADRWVHTTGFDYVEDYVGAGNFIYSYNGEETVVTTTETTTLEELVGLINNDADNPGVSASLLYYGNAYHMVLSGKDAGSDYAISVNSSSTEVWEAGSALTVGNDNATLSTLITNLDQFGEGGSLTGDETIVISGTDHNNNSISPVTINLTANTKISHVIDAIEQAYDGNVKAVLENGKIVVTDKFSGVSQFSISLAYNDTDASASLTLPAMAVTSEGAATTASLSGFAPSDFTRTQIAQDSKVKVDGFPSSSAVAEVQQITHASAITSGTFTLSYGGYTTSAIAYNASISDIQAAIDAIPSVQPGDITVSGETLDTNGNLTFTFKNTLGDVSTILIDSSGLSGSLAVAEQTKGVDEWISRSSNTVDNVLYGVAIHLHNVTSASGEQLTLTRDIESVKQKLGKLVDSYNDVIGYIKEKTGYNSQTKTAGVLMGNYVVSTLNTRLYSPLMSQTTGFLEDIDSFLTPAQIGLTLDRDGVLSFDGNAFDEAIANDYTGVLALIGANKTGSSDSNTVKFYQASSNYTAAGTYDVEVTVSGGAITSARIKAEDDLTWRDAGYDGNLVTGESSFDDNGDPVNPENGLQLSVDLSTDGTFTATVRVRQGFAGVLKDVLDKALKTTTGSIDIDQSNLADMIDGLQDKIDTENNRLDRRKQQLVDKFARLEKLLTMLKSQMSALGLSG